MKKSRFSTEQIIGFIKQADAGMAVAELCRRHGFSPASFYQWRAKYGGMEADEAKRLKELEVQNTRLKKLLAEAHLDIEALKVGFGGKTLAPQRKREAIRRMLEHTPLSERRACRLAGLSRDAFRHAPVPTPATQALSARLVELAQTHRRFGYRRLHDLLRPEFPSVNHKKIYRLYEEAKLKVRKRRKAKRPVGERQKLLASSMPNDTWSMDFVFDALANARRIKCLTVVDDFTRESVDIAVDHGISGAYVVRLLDQAACFRGYPRAVRTDNGPEFTSRAFIAWTQQHGIEHILIEPGAPTQNAYIESFNGKFRDECLNEHWFTSLAQARDVIADWRRHYNQIRPHSSCGRIPPAQFAANYRTQQANNAVPFNPGLYQ
ncbi:IS3-like element IS476 family transposase [Xanthomonas campestris pv. campestris]|uniref:IS3-like element IS476 family transposase n=1 Tax=Xanthomonas campestris TaxID=339 RepID=UPI001C854F9A|nr:IS3-like element IS476 family transposase [Xanthomonas campestris]MCC5053868.1 IS3-like element IS476 family transposase [Xanthomonas campestris pv. aberrans]MDM7685167.1 IS3-like element IS476 family transposase [Xanthomonas campestris pv. campestris]MEB1128324.1 IS3-like element IS476 family transposase [Xanthomonas campestris pv. campestris]